MLNEVKPYVYKLTHPETGEFYIGSRVRNKESWDKDLPKYRTSSKYVKPMFDEFEMQLLMEFTQGSCAVDYEQYMIHESWGNPLLLNKSCHHGKKARFHPLGIKHSEATKQANRMRKIGNKNRLGASVPEEVKEQIRQKLIGYKHTEEAKLNMKAAAARKTKEAKAKGGQAWNGKKRTEQNKENVRQANIGTRFWNNGEICVRTKDCPEGFKPGMLPRTQQRKRKNERQET